MVSERDIQQLYYGATSKFVDDIALGLDKGQHTLAIFLDIKKAFDTIDHTIQLGKMKHAGIGEGTLRLVGNCLDNRKQCVLYNGVKSNVRSLSPIGFYFGTSIVPIIH